MSYVKVQEVRKKRTRMVSMTNASVDLSLFRIQRLATFMAMYLSTRIFEGNPGACLTITSQVLPKI